MWASLCASRELAWRLTVRDVSARYRHTFLGFLWAFLPPLATSAIFVFLNSQKVLDIGPTPIAYAPYVLIGTTLWQMFVDALQAPLRTVEQSRDMLIKINFPREALILSGLGLVGFNFLIRIVILVGTFLYFQIPVTPWILLAPLAMLMLVVLGTMVGLILTPLGILYKDVGQLLTISITFWLFLTPVVYPPPTDGPAAILSTLNPVSPLLITARDWMIGVPSEQLPAFVAVSIGTVLFLCIGWLLFRLAMPHVIARLGG